MGLFAGLASRPLPSQADARTAGNNSHAEPADLCAEALAPCLTGNHDGDHNQEEGPFTSDALLATPLVGDKHGETQDDDSFSEAGERSASPTAPPLATCLPGEHNGENEEHEIHGEAISEGSSDDEESQREAERRAAHLKNALATAFSAFFLEHPDRLEPTRYPHAVWCLPAHAVHSELDADDLYKTLVAQWTSFGYHEAYHRLRVAFEALLSYRKDLNSGQDICFTKIGSVNSDNDALFNKVVGRSDGNCLANEVLKGAYEGHDMDARIALPDFRGYRRVVLDNYIFDGDHLYEITESLGREQQ